MKHKPDIKVGEVEIYNCRTSLSNVFLAWKTNKLIKLARWAKQRGDKYGLAKD